MGQSSEGKFNIAVGAIIEDRADGAILLLKRSSQADFSPGIWEDITGRLHQFEHPEVGARREIKEECGLDVDIIKPLKIFHIFRGEETADNELVGIIYWCQTDTSAVKLSSEHEEYKWLKPEEALELVEHPGVREDIGTFVQERSKRAD